MKRWEWEFGIRDWGFGNGEWGLGADSRQRIAETGEWGVGNGDWGLRNHVYKKGCEKMMTIFSQPLFHILYQLVRDLMGAGIFPPRLMNSSARNLLISKTGA